MVEVRLRKQGCEIAATDPDLTTMGLIDAIKSSTSDRRRLPHWMREYFRWNAPPDQAGRSVVPVALSAGAIVVLILAYLSIGSRHGHGANAPVFPWPASLAMLIAMVVLVLGLAVCQLRSATVMFSATRGEAPTFWMRQGANIGINVVIAAVFFVLGLLVH